MFNKIKNKGFTIIELLVVVLIIGVLAGIALPMFFNAVEKSRTSEPLQVLSQIARAEQRYKLQTLEYTNEADKLDITIKDYTSDQEVTDNEFDSEFFNFTIGTENATAQRKDGDYTLGVDYTTSKLSCTPAEHRICKSLGLEEGAPAETSTSITPTCTTETYNMGGSNDNVMQTCDYGGEYTIYNETWCNGSVPRAAGVPSKDTPHGMAYASSGSCVEGELLLNNDYSVVSIDKYCRTTGSSGVCDPNSYYASYKMEYDPSTGIQTYSKCRAETINSSDGSCFFEDSYQQNGDYSRYCNAWDSEGKCTSWDDWENDMD